MPADGAAHLESIRDELICPHCQYSLRGLPGDVVRCPECGTRCDLSQMVSAHWTQSWREAPGYSRMLWPVSWLATTCWFVPLVYGFEIEAPREPGSGIVTAVSIALILVVWITLLVSTHARFVPGRGTTLLVLSHLITLAYVIGLIVFIGGIIFAFDLARLSPMNLMSLVLAAIAAGAMGLCYQGEKYMANECIREHMAAQHRLE